MWRKSIMPYGCGQSSPRIIVFNHFSSLSFPSSFIYRMALKISPLDSMLDISIRSKCDAPHTVADSGCEKGGTKILVGPRPFT